MNKTEVKIEGFDKNISAEIIDKKIWFKINDQTYSYELAELSGGRFKKTKSASKSPDKILAPMPGKVTKIFVSENQLVNKGDALLVMEAMKMEYTLKSDINAKVEKICAAVGEQVTLGFLLIQLHEKNKDE